MIMWFCFFMDGILTWNSPTALFRESFISLFKWHCDPKISLDSFWRRCYFSFWMALWPDDIMRYLYFKYDCKCPYYRCTLFLYVMGTILNRFPISRITCQSVISLLSLPFRLLPQGLYIRWVALALVESSLLLLRGFNMVPLYICQGFSRLTA